MAYIPGDEIRHMRYLLETVHQGEGVAPALVRAEPKKVNRREDVKRRIVSITEHLCRHVERLTAEDIGTVLDNPTDAIYAAQTIDELYEAVRVDDNDVVIVLVRQFHSYFTDLNEAQIAHMLGTNAFRGEEIDVFGLIQTLGYALNEYDNTSVVALNESAAPSSFGKLVNDLCGLMNQWDQGSNGAQDCVQDIIKVLKENHGIIIEDRNGS